MKMQAAAPAEHSKQSNTSISEAIQQKQGELSFADNRPEAALQRQAIALMNNSPQALQQKARSNMLNNSPQTLAQRKQQNAWSNGIIQQREEAEPLPRQLATETPLQRQEAPSPKPNNTGLPDNLKSGVESLSGISLDQVRVHYNSPEPAQLNAHAYAQGTDIHVAPGQEQHLPHEAWHVVQQAQGRVKPTMQMKGNVAVNDDAGLEAEADVMGTKALGVGENTAQCISITHPQSHLSPNLARQTNSPIQGYFESSYFGGAGGTYRHADDFSVVVDSNHALYAENGKAAAASLALANVNSKITLEQTNATSNFWEGNRMWKKRQATLYKVIAKNTQNNTKGDNMDLWADCGRANGEVLGNNNRHGVYKQPGTGTATNVSGKGIAGANGGLELADGNPAGMKIEIMQNYMSSVYHDPTTHGSTKTALEKVFQDAAVVHQQMVTYSNKYNDPLDPLKDLNGYWPLLEQLSEIYLSWYNAKHEVTKDTIDTGLGINKKANPSVGQGYTMSTGGNGPPTWPFHWAGVIMTSNDNADKVALENYSVSDYNVANKLWNFEMYGTVKKDQTFHEQHLASGTHKDQPTTMVVEGN